MAAQESGTGNAPGTGKVRKRLSVVSDNVLIEGLEKANLEVNEVQRDGATVITEFYGKSEKGYAPYNPRKANQDVFDSATDEKTGSLLFVVMDGHGEFGHKVSGFFKEFVFKNIIC
mmetsp:Transcript_13749/g.16364  ORF Transcript_13749/g.16364 Transcript_13749/m.16364 type:complete len:116 (+) Transcript_13749:53-400(+)